VRCRICGAPRGTNVYCWGCTDGVNGTQLKPISDKDLARYGKRNSKPRASSSAVATLEPTELKQPKKRRKKVNGTIS